jgi:hypothetical protein
MRQLISILQYLHTPDFRVGASLTACEHFCCIRGTCLFFLVLASNHQPTWNSVTVFVNVLELFERYTDCATYWIVLGSNPGRDKRFLFSQNRPEWLWVPPSQFNGYWGSLLEGKAAIA